MTELLIQYFEQHAEHSIECMKKAVLAVGYYERIRTRLAKKEDLSDELPILKKVSPKDAMQVVKDAIAEYKEQIAHSWDLSPRLAELGKVNITQIASEREHLPRVELTFRYKSEAGAVSVSIKSAGETYKLDIEAGKNPMAAALARAELEKQLSYIALTS